MHANYTRIRTKLRGKFRLVFNQISLSVPKVQVFKVEDMKACSRSSRVHFESQANVTRVIWPAKVAR
jgi:hypothetical protein